MNARSTVEAGSRELGHARWRTAAFTRTIRNGQPAVLLLDLEVVAKTRVADVFASAHVVVAGLSWVILLGRRGSGFHALLLARAL